MDAHKNFAFSTVATAPSPATSGTSLVVAAGDGAKFPPPPFNATIWPLATQPSTTNAEIVRVTNISTDTLTITRAQESTSARTVVIGDQIANTITVKVLTDAENPPISNLTAGTLAVSPVFGENTSLVYVAALSADGKYCGLTQGGTAGETLAFGDVCYLKAADSKWWLAKADAASTSGDVKIGMCVLAGAANAATTMLRVGTIRADANFPTFTISAPVHISAATGGKVVVAAPTGTDSVTRRLGFANTADEFEFMPSPNYYTHT